MRSLIITLVFFSSYISYGQNITNNVISILSKETLISNVKADPLFIKHKLIASKYETDSIDFDVVIYGDMFSADGRSDAISTTQPYYHLLFYTIHDTIFYSMLIERMYNENGDSLIVHQTIFSKIDTTILVDYISKHNSKYFSNWLIKDFLDPSSDYGWFGFLCGGYLPSMQKEAYLLAKLVNVNDQKKLKKLASSFSSQERAFGTAGLYFLQLKGKKLSKELLELIRMNQASNLQISTCEGCILDEQTMSEALQEDKLRSMYKYLVDSKLL